MEQHRSPTLARVTQALVAPVDRQPRADVLALEEGWISGWYDAQTPYYSVALPEVRDVRVARTTYSGVTHGDVDGGFDQKIAAIQTRYLTDQATGDYWVEYHLVVVDLWEETAMVNELAATGSCSSTQVCPEERSKLAMGDVNGDRFDDLVMTTPGRNVLHVWYGSATGLQGGPSYTARDLPWLSLDVASLAVGDVTGDGLAEIALGRPGTGWTSPRLQGDVVLVPGSRNGPMPAAAQLVNQDGVGPLAGPAAGDPIGEQVTGDGMGDLIVGAPGKKAQAGMLAVVRGAAGGASATQAQVVHAAQLSAVHPLSPVKESRFGTGAW
ncbi:VCBS repeat-containing protein [Nonomuraea wenchangensis]